MIPIFESLKHRTMLYFYQCSDINLLSIYLVSCDLFHEHIACFSRALASWHVGKLKRACRVHPNGSYLGYWWSWSHKTARTSVDDPLPQQIRAKKHAWEHPHNSRTSKRPHRPTGNLTQNGNVGYLIIFFTWPRAMFRHKNVFLGVRTPIIKMWLSYP